MSRQPSSDFASVHGVVQPQGRGCTIYRFQGLGLLGFKAGLGSDFSGFRLRAQTVQTTTPKFEPELLLEP